ncbi:unnamed protein product [Medioppia subpectinata]|uniref:Uncharacterized protein n=1 Tax=Medioppia subpectinata TaxID=1979941 RepID=A0A7R9M0K0_9ACAR|nr:unnamed protein product [Medioppia subpectinata]CAG2122790.1 unnamed protein product [Medioppia subpectinata]
MISETLGYCRSLTSGTMICRHRQNPKMCRYMA